MSFLFRAPAKPPTHRTPEPAVIPAMEGLDTAATYHGDRFGGDFYDFVQVGDRLVFGLLDVAGKCTDALGIVAAVQDVFRESVPELFDRGACSNEAIAMMELTVRINRRVMEASGGVHNCAAFSACCNRALGTLCYVNAGHNPGLLRFGSTVSRLSATGLPLGLFSHATHDAPTFVVPDGGALVLVSRGLVEAANRKEEFGLDRVESAILESSQASAHELCQSVLGSMTRFLGQRTPKNDISALALVRGVAATQTFAAGSS